MKMITGYKFSDLLLFFRLCLPAIMFIGLCMGIFIVFIFVIGTLDLIYGLFLGGAWLSLFTLYLILGVTFTCFVAHYIRSISGSEELHVQNRMAFLSGFPFYILCILCLIASAISFFIPDINPATTFVYGIGFFSFILVSGGYLFLTRFFLGRSTATVQQ